MNMDALHTIRRLFLVTAGGVLMAFNINTFANAGGLLPGGFTGLVLLVQDIGQRYFNVKLPFSIMYYALNSVPAVFCFMFIGKKFTLYSILMVAITGLRTDWMPSIVPTSLLIDFINLHDTLLSAVFGGILNAVAICLCLYAGATSGGTDFIAIYISEKYRKDAWNYIFAGNCVILFVAGYLFSMNKALYSIIFQYVSTLTIGVLYRNYQQSTLMIITDMPKEVSEVINNMTGHGATRFDGVGCFENKERIMIYSIVTASQVKKLIPAIKKIDNDAFINVVKTEQLSGHFYQRPRD
jgi:uncharacterized membrane-anchored protein YitT (DUF2179 family)